MPQDEIVSSLTQSYVHKRCECKQRLNKVTKEIPQNVILVALIKAIYKRCDCKQRCNKVTKEILQDAIVTSFAHVKVIKEVLQDALDPRKQNSS
jgi:hypothetical protein